MSEEVGKRDKKKSKKVYLKRLGAEKRKYKNVLHPGLKGFICVSDNNEAKCVRETYNLLSEYDKSTCEESLGENHSGDVDFCSAVAAEVEALKEDGPRFQQVMTKVKHILFFKCPVEVSPTKFLYGVMRDVAKSKTIKSQALIRILPAEVTVSVSEENILNGVRKLIVDHFEGEGTTFNVLVKVRNNSSLDTNVVTKKCIKLIKEAHPKNEFMTRKPEVSLLIEVLCRTCCLGVAPDYAGLRKYNLRELAKDGPASDENWPLLKNRYE